MPLSDYPITVPPGDPLPPMPATIIAPHDGTVLIRHYLGNTGRPEFDRLWLELPAAAAQEITNGVEVLLWPGDAIEVTVQAGDEILLSLNGSVDGTSDEANSGPTRPNTSDYARVHVDNTLPGGWGRYIEWEDRLGASIFNDSRTLIYYPSSWNVGFVGWLG